MGPGDDGEDEENWEAEAGDARSLLLLLPHESYFDAAASSSSVGLEAPRAGLARCRLSPRANAGPDIDKCRTNGVAVNSKILLLRRNAKPAAEVAFDVVVVTFRNVCRPRAFFYIKNTFDVGGINADVRTKTKKRNCGSVGVGVGMRACVCGHACVCACVPACEGILFK